VINVRASAESHLSRLAREILLFGEAPDWATQMPVFERAKAARRRLPTPSFRANQGDRRRRHVGAIFAIVNAGAQSRRAPGFAHNYAITQSIPPLTS
jgi:hypothetical protein